MRKIWLMFLLTVVMILGIPAPAYAATHNVDISWFYGQGTGDLVDGEAGTKLGSTTVQVKEGVFDYSDYANNPDGANFYRMYGIVPIIRINGNYYLLVSKYVASLGPTDDLDNTVTVIEQDTDITIKFYYAKVKFAAQESKDKITIHIDGSANDNLTTENHYEAYQIFHVTKSNDVQEDVTTDETVGKAITGEDIGFSYFIRESDEWYDVIASMTDWFKLEQTTEEGMYIVSLADGVPANEATAIAIANELEKHTQGKTSIDITSEQTRTDINPGYYLIVSPINSNLILATTNINITEKAFYPNIEKTVAEEDKNAAIGSEVHFNSKIFIPKGSKAKMIITDSMTEGLTFIPESLTLNKNINYTFQETENGFQIIIAADDIKALAAEESVDLILDYSAELNKNAIVAVRDDETVAGNVNEITLEYVNYIQSDSVDVDTTQFTLLKYDSDDDTKTPMGGATFQLYNENGNIIQLYEIKPNEVYRLAESTDSSSMTDLTTVANKTIKVIGLDADKTYKLRETQAPDGYNKLSSDIDVQPTTDLSLEIEVPNSSGSLLPNTGGIGTTILYVIGGSMIAAAIVYLIIKNR